MSASWDGAALVVTDAAEAAFAVFYTRRYRDVVKLALALTGDRYVAEDLAQEAFARAWRDWERVAACDRPEAWVRRVASNLAVSRWRRLAAEGRALGRMALGREPEVAPIPAEAEGFWREVRALPAVEAKVVALRYIADLPVAEIAATLGCPEGTVKSHLHRARKRLAARLKSAEVTS
jgi:RNA polymerase sigma-70 factor, ECF subfamily